MHASFENYAPNLRALLALVFVASVGTGTNALAATNQSDEALNAPNGTIHLVLAPAEKFVGRLFLINDWDGGDADNQNAAEELNRNSRIKQDVTLLSDFPDHAPRKVDVDDLVMDAQVLADASKTGPIAVAMGAHSRHMLAWLTKLPEAAYDFRNIVIVTHSNWNELDGSAGYKANYQPGDPPLVDTHGEKLRRGLYPNLAKISDLGVTILEIPRTDSGPGGWGGNVTIAGRESAEIKSLDISDLGLVFYLKTGAVEATRSQRNQFISDTLQKPVTLGEVNRTLITRYWEKNHHVPGEKEDYLP